MFRPALWTDNYVVMLLAGEQTTVNVTWSLSDGPVANVEATPFNAVARTPTTTPSPSPPTPAGQGTCSFVPDTDTAQDQYSFHTAVDSAACCTACLNDPTCQFASFVQAVCYFKNTSKDPEPGVTFTSKQGVTLVLPRRA
jgi:hypothetical protein